MTDLDELDRINNAGDRYRHITPGVVAELIAEVRRLRADAERYRYLRSIDRRACLEAEGPAAGCWIDCEGENGELYLLTEEDADAAIDAAIAVHPKEGV